MNAKEEELQHWLKEGEKDIQDSLQPADEEDNNQEPNMALE